MARPSLILFRSQLCFFAIANKRSKWGDGISNQNTQVSIQVLLSFIEGAKFARGTWRRMSNI